MKYYDIDGDEITMEQCERLLSEDISKRRLALTQLMNGVTISTVWIGMDILGNGCIYETIVFVKGKYVDCKRVPTKELAYINHVHYCSIYVPVGLDVSGSSSTEKK